MATKQGDIALLNEPIALQDVCADNRWPGLAERVAPLGVRAVLGVPIRVTCPHCGGRGETWTEWCHLCRGTGESLLQHPVRVSVPPGVADGARFRFRVTSPDASSVRVEVRVAIRSSAA